LIFSKGTSFSAPTYIKSFDEIVDIYTIEDTKIYTQVKKIPKQLNLYHEEFI
jgi:hypothetical protein